MRRWQLLVAAMIVGLGALGTASAASARPGHFLGSAPGSVSCNMKVTVAFSPAMTNSGGTVKRVFGTLTQCTASNPDVTIKKGTISAGTAFTDSQLDCTAPPPSSLSFTVNWKGKYNGTVPSLPGATFAGSAAYFPSSVTESSETEVTGPGNLVGITLPGTGGAATVTQSFAGGPIPSGSSATLYSQYTSSQLATQCAGPHGVKKLIFEGSVSIG